VDLDGCRLNGWNLCEVTRGVLAIGYFKLNEKSKCYEQKWKDDFTQMDGEDITV
jgi:hypothetical protein